jgi:hypothetical protein
MAPLTEVAVVESRTVAHDRSVGSSGNARVGAPRGTLRRGRRPSTCGILSSTVHGALTALERRSCTHRFLRRRAAGVGTSRAMDARSTALWATENPRHPLTYG